MKNAPVILWGNLERNEFNTPLHCFRQLENLHFAFPHRPVLDETPVCHVLFQSRPNEFSASFLQTLIRAAPLAPLLLILGAACEGEIRTGKPLPGCFRLYACQWNSYHAAQVKRFLEGLPSLFSLPKSCADDEIYLFQCKKEKIDNPPILSDLNQKYAILNHYGPLGNDFSMNSFLSTICVKRGISVDFISENNDNSFYDNILADASDAPFDEIARSVEKLKLRFGDAKIELFVHSPRINEIIDLKKCGVDRVHAKPFFWYNFLDEFGKRNR